MSGNSITAIQKQLVVLGLLQLLLAMTVFITAFILLILIILRQTLYPQFSNG